MNWRVLVVLEEGAEAEVWEQYASTAPGLFTTVVELVVGQNASLRFVSAQGLDEQSLVFGTQRAKVARDGKLDWVVLGFGAANGKIFQNTILEGEGAEGKVTGAYALGGRQHLDYDTTQEHAAAHCNSDLAFRGILAGRSSAVWRGMIKVDEGAQETDAFQESRNLLLSKRAHADAIPGLEILANDVRCTHAAAIAQIDPSSSSTCAPAACPWSRPRAWSSRASWPSWSSASRRARCARRSRARSSGGWRAAGLTAVVPSN